MTRQKGVALLVVLMILAIMAALASEMTVRYQINLKRTSYTRMRLQQNWLAELAESQAMRILEQDLRDNEKYLTHEQLWAQPQRIQLASGDVVSWQLSDEQACYNINALINAPTDRMKEPHCWKTLASPMPKLRRWLMLSPTTSITTIFHAPPVPKMSITRQVTTPTPLADDVSGQSVSSNKSKG